MVVDRAIDREMRSTPPSLILDEIKGGILANPLHFLHPMKRFASMLTSRCISRPHRSVSDPSASPGCMRYLTFTSKPIFIHSSRSVRGVKNIPLKEESWRVPSRYSAASGPICRSKRFAKKPGNLVMTGSSSPAGAITSMWTRRSPTRVTSNRVGIFLQRMA